MKERVAVSAFLSVFLAGVIQAQSVPNLSGEWKLNAAKSNYGPVPAPEVMTRIIKHHEPSLEISSYQKGAQGEARSELKYTTDGKECVNKMTGGEAKGTAKWQGGNLVIQSVRNFQGVELKSSETWALSGGGKIMTVSSHIVTPQNESDIKLVFEKQ